MLDYIGIIDKSPKTKESIEQNYEHTKIRLQRSFTFQKPPVFVQKTATKTTTESVKRSPGRWPPFPMRGSPTLWSLKAVPFFFFETASRL